MLSSFADKRNAHLTVCCHPMAASRIETFTKVDQNCFGDAFPTGIDRITFKNGTSGNYKEVGE